ncbi:MAG: hypothetical protein KF911_04685 [Pseudomonadales bacterium]|nr:hypothetical protein [Pseudomonadales bacterium]
MKLLFIVVLVLNLLVEGLAAVSLILGPDGLSAAGSGEQWSMHYGFAVIAIASASLWVWPRRTDLGVVTAVLGILLVFHSALVVSLATAGDQQAGMVIHAVLAALCLVTFVRRSSWCLPVGDLSTRG